MPTLLTRVRHGSQYTSPTEALPINLHPKLHLTLFLRSSHLLCSFAGYTLTNYVHTRAREDVIDDILTS